MPALEQEVPLIPEDSDVVLDTGTAVSPELSVFEHLVRGDAPPPPELPHTEEMPPPPPKPPATVPEAAPTAVDTEATPEVAIIAELGPGLRLRLRQLGFGTDAALAAAHPDQLRQGLGEISRMLNVEAWIDDARRREAAAQAASNP